MLLKHAPQCPESAAAIEQIYLDAGFPVGAYTNIYASNDQVATIIANPVVQGVSLTGSERAGAAVAEIAGRHLKKVVLELGGSDPFIVLSTDDLDATVDAAIFARTDNNGQACNAGKRMVIVDSLYDAFVEKFTERMLATWRDGARRDLQDDMMQLTLQIVAKCYAIEGENKYHAIFTANHRCVIASPSTLATGLIALGASLPPSKYSVVGVT